MSSLSCASSVTTQCKPHAIASLRPVASIGVSATIGTLGRSRDARKPVEPDLVQHTMAAAFTVCATCARRRGDRIRPSSPQAPCAARR